LGIGIAVGVAAIVAIFLIALVFGPVYQVGADERAYLTTWGNPGDKVIAYAVAQNEGNKTAMSMYEPYVRMAVMQPGLHWKTPLAQSVHTLDVKTHVYKAECESVSKDQQDIKTTVAANYHLDPQMVPVIDITLGSGYETTIDAKLQDAVKAVTAKFSGQQLTDNRSDVQMQIDRQLREYLLPYHIMLDVNGIAITDFKFTPEYQAAIDRKSVAIQDKQTAEQKYQETVINQKSELAKLETVAKGMEFQKSQVTPELIKLREIESQNNWIAKWNGQMPQYNFGGSGVMPTFSVGGTMAVTS
jgi:prohibitin 2